LIEHRFQSIENFALEATMAQEYKPGEIVPQSGIYAITHPKRG
jgi:hypothetical protein